MRIATHRESRDENKAYWLEGKASCENNFCTFEGRVWSTLIHVNNSGKETYLVGITLGSYYFDLKENQEIKFTLNSGNGKSNIRISCEKK